MGITAVGLPQRATEGELENGKVDGETKSACRAPDAGSVKFCTEDRLSGFDCNICLSTAETPIVTLCGHLFCWHCIHLWSGNKHGGHRCPVCKAGLDLQRVIAICARKGKNGKNRAQTEAGPLLRTRGLRSEGGDRIWPQLSVWGNLLRCNMPLQSSEPLPRGLDGSPMIDEQQQQSVFLSRLLLILGTFIILCLLFF